MLQTVFFHLQFLSCLTDFGSSCWCLFVWKRVTYGHKVVFSEREDLPQTKLLVDHKPGEEGTYVFSHVWFPSWASVCMSVDRLTCRKHRLHEGRLVHVRWLLIYLARVQFVCRKNYFIIFNYFSWYVSESCFSVVWCTFSSHNCLVFFLRSVIYFNNMQ